MAAQCPSNRRRNVAEMDHDYFREAPPPPPPPHPEDHNYHREAPLLFDHDYCFVAPPAPPASDHDYCAAIAQHPDHDYCFVAPPAPDHDYCAAVAQHQDHDYCIPKQANHVNDPIAATTSISDHSYCAKVPQLPQPLDEHTQDAEGDWNVAGPSGLCRGPSVSQTERDGDVAEPSGLCRGSSATSRIRRRSIGRVSNEGVSIIEVESAVRGRLKTFWLSCADDAHTDLVTFLDEIEDIVVRKIREELRNSALKINLVVRTRFRRDEDGSEIAERCFKTKNEMFLQADDINAKVEEQFGKLLREKSEHAAKGSGWSLIRVIGLELRINKFTPSRGSSFIELPSKIKHSKSVINVGNGDNFCFKYAIWAKNIACNPQRVSSYMNDNAFFNGYNWNCIMYPVSITEISKFEKRNNISINVFGLDEDDMVYPIKIVDYELEDHRDLLYLKNESTSHYCWIKDFGRLVKKQITNHKDVAHICKRCMLNFTSASILANHKRSCNSKAPNKICLPSENENWLHFKNYSKTMRVPFVAYADFECILTSVSSCDPSDHNSFTCARQKHDVMSFCILLVSASGQKYDPILHRGKDAMSVFISTVRELANYVRAIYRKKIPMKPLSAEEIQNFENSESCHICGEVLGDDRVKDHDHITGEYRGAAHGCCNIQFQIPSFLPVVIHNLSNYDSHLIVPHLGYDQYKIECIPNSEEKYISFSKYIDRNFSIRFIDSFRFMSASLSKLVNASPGDKFRQTSHVFSDVELDLVTRKGVFPYEYVNTWNKLDEECLPPKEAFYSSLTEEDISDAEYYYAQSMWNKFHCTTLGEYSDVYLKMDVLLLADVFENFRDVCRATYKLDPAWYFTAPGLAFDAMLKHTRISLELMTDYDMLLMIEKGIRGGISQCTKRYSEANNKYLETFDEKEESRYIIYLDANNLYGWALSAPLPSSGFRWVDCPEDIENISDESPKGYILEVDLEYPRILHDKHNDLPLCPVSSLPPNSKFPKLMTTLHDKERYVLHYRNLKQALSLGLKLKTVHRVLEFNQSCWMKSYIDLNSEKRQSATSEFEKDFYKLMNNAVFGKTMENVRKRINFEIVSNEKRLRKLIASSMFLDRTIYGENLVGVHSRKRKTFMNKPIYIGQTVLDISKILMYNFYYNHLRLRYEKNVSLLYMDTDSFILEVKTWDFYEDMRADIELYDLSNYPRDHPCYSEMNKKIVGKMKDECGGRPITHFAGLRSKLYSFCVKEGGTEKRAKGVKKATIKNSISFDDYVHCLRNNISCSRRMTLIKSTSHELYTVELNKVALSPFDDKRFVMDDGVNTFSWGHYQILKRRRWEDT
nr:TPA_asm: PolB [Ladona dragonfly adintovirus]